MSHDRRDVVLKNHPGDGWGVCGVYDDEGKLLVQPMEL